VTDSRETTPTTIPRGHDLRPWVVALIRAHDGEVFIGNQTLGEAVVFDGEIVVESTEDGARYRLVEATEDTP
jgi:hypothetical protein